MKADRPKSTRHFLKLQALIYFIIGNQADVHEKIFVY